jgi:hypothetical protein
VNGVPWWSYLSLIYVYAKNEYCLFCDEYIFHVYMMLLFYHGTIHAFVLSLCWIFLTLLLWMCHLHVWGCRLAGWGSVAFVSFSRMTLEPTRFFIALRVCRIEHWFVTLGFLRILYLFSDFVRILWIPF